MKTITFVRHAKSIANAGAVTMVHDAIPLSEVGRAQAKALASLLEVKPSKVFVSKYIRTHETAEPFCQKWSITPEVHPLIHEFSSIDPVLIQGMNGEQRRPIADAYWKEANPNKRMGIDAETFIEFEKRVSDFLPELQGLPDGTVLFGHGIWLSMLIWKQLGFSASDSFGMTSFRKFQAGLPMLNCAVFHVTQTIDQWKIQVDERILRFVASHDFDSLLLT